MKFFKKNSSDGKALKNKSLLKYGGFSLGLTAIVLAGVIVLNILMGVLDDRGLLSVDMTTSGDYTISEENEDFIKTVDRDVQITVLSNKGEYQSGLSNYAYQYFGVADAENYFGQTVKLLESYNELNRQITVRFIDYFGTETKTIAEKHPDIFYGDIIVKALDQKGNEKERVVSFTDIYSYSDTSGYASQGYDSYYVDGNNVETAVSSAINLILYGETKNLGYISSHSETGVFEEFYAEALELNGFEITEITKPVVDSIDAELDTVAIIAPSSDLLPEEVTALSVWLDNGGKKGKSLIFMPGVSVTTLPNLNEFLEEWGIKYSSGQLYATDSQQYLSTPTTLAGYPDQGEVTEKIVESTQGLGVFGQNVPMEKAFETFENKTTYSIMSTSDTTTIMPNTAGDDWAPADGAEKKSYSNLIICADQKIIDDKPAYSYVAAFSSMEFVYSTWASTQYRSRCLNFTTAVNAALYVSGVDTDSAKTFVAKTRTESSFADSVTADKAAAVSIIFIAAIPLIIVAAGIFVFVRRKRRCA